MRGCSVRPRTHAWRLPQGDATCPRVSPALGRNDDWREAEISAAPVVHRGDTGGGEGPTIRDMGTRLCLGAVLPTGKLLPGEREGTQERG